MKILNRDFKKYGLALIMAVGSYQIHAQQVWQFSQNQQNKYMLNPAATGADGSTKVNLGYRRQWLGLGDEPSTFYLGGAMALKPVEVKRPLALRTSHNENYQVNEEQSQSKLKHGVGAYLLNDNYGAFGKTEFNLFYALHYGVSDKLTVSAGINTGFNSFSFDPTKAEVTDVSEVTYQNFITQQNKVSLINMNLGLYVYSDEFFAGYSNQQMMGQRIAFSSITDPTLRTHHNFMLGYVLNSSDDVRIEPALYVNMVKGAPVSVLANVTATLQNKYIAGLGLRSGDALILTVGFKPDQNFRVGYSFDFNTSKLRNYNAGGHEVGLTYFLK